MGPIRLHLPRLPRTVLNPGLVWAIRTANRGAQHYVYAIRI